MNDAEIDLGVVYEHQPSSFHASPASDDLRGLCLGPGLRDSVQVLMAQGFGAMVFVLFLGRFACVGLAITIVLN